MFYALASPAVNKRLDNSETNPSSIRGGTPSVTEIRGDSLRRGFSSTRPYGATLWQISPSPSFDVTEIIEIAFGTKRPCVPGRISKSQRL
jgi:hypothetical protein